MSRKQTRQPAGTDALVAEAQKAVESTIATVWRQAPIIEAAGSLDEALRLGLLEAGASCGLEDIKVLVPFSRGGVWDRPNAESTWRGMVAASCRQQGVSFEDVCRKVARIRAGDSGGGETASR